MQSLSATKLAMLADVRLTRLPGRLVSIEMLRSLEIYELKDDALKIEVYVAEVGDWVWLTCKNAVGLLERERGYGQPEVYRAWNGQASLNHITL